MDLSYINGERKETRLDTAGYITEHDYFDFVNTRTDEFCLEKNIIDKIVRNEEGFFDFSKNLVDIGCEYGIYSMFTDFNHSYMFDGNREKSIIAQFNMLLHGKEGRFTMTNTLLSDRDESINYDGFFTECSFVDKGIYRGGKQCSATTLDAFGIENVGLIKMDVEGMEGKVMMGSVGTIVRNNFPPILFELWEPYVDELGRRDITQEKIDGTKKLFTDLGYEIIWRWGDSETHLAIRQNR